MVRTNRKRWIPIVLFVTLVAASSLLNINASKNRGAQTVRVLYLGNDWYQDNSRNWINANLYIIDALEGSATPSFSVTHIPPKGDDGYLATELGFDEFDVVIFSEVWRSHFSDDQLSDLKKFVKKGGGFIMFGGWGGFGGRPPYGGWDGSVSKRCSR